MLKKFIDMHILVLKNTSNKTLAIYINRNIIPIFVILVLWNKIRYSKLKILMKKKIIKKNYNYIFKLLKKKEAITNKILTKLSY